MGEIIDGSRLINDSESSGAVGGNTRGTYLGSGSSHITDCGNGLVYVSGTTDCNRKSSSVSVTVQLERLENGSWHYVTDRSFSDSNTTSVSGSFYISVKKGYYYRVCGQHTASANGVTESTTSQTDGIWIG